MLQHRSWPGWFAILETPRGPTIGYQVGDDKAISERVARPAVHAPGVLSRWLQELKRRQETPDLWGELEQEKMATLAEGQENTPFTSTEREQIAAVVAKVLEQARDTFEVPEEELRELEDVGKYARESASWVRGRIDWVNLVAGYVFNKVASSLLTPDTMHKLFHALTTGLGPLYGHHLPTIGPGI